MRHLLLLLMLLLTPAARAQEFILPTPEAGHANGGVEPAMVPLPRPALVVGEVTTPRFRLLYTAKSEGSARQLAGNIEAIRDHFVSVLGRDWPGVTEIRVGVGREEFEALALPGGAPPGWAVALAYPSHRIVLLNALTLAGPEGMVTLRHELAHVALGQLARGWPRWFQEGLAQNLTGENWSMTHYTALFRAVTQERVFRFEHLHDAWPDLPSDVEIAYAQSAAFVAWLSAKHGPEGMGRLVDEVATGQPFEQAFGKAFKSSLWVEELAWREGVAARYGWLPLTTSSSLLWLGMTGLVVAAYVRRRKQKEEHLAQMEAQDVAEEAELREALEAELAQQRALLTPPPPQPVDGGESADAAKTMDAAAPEWNEPIAANGPESEDDEEDSPRPHKPTLH
ncbi:peptidase MA family metallohydrolase [Archangium lansingense]|uniref:peptidase MA family metallohydrolase n=1 Tax=Archangium lansingense TaxID=2995310 RepID=UPI003B77BE27